VSPEGFIVVGKEGPLRVGEEKRATVWGEKIENLLKAKGGYHAI